jgi:dihydroneopterin aldolase
MPWTDQPLRPDKIIIADLEVQTNIGVTATERMHPQRLLVSVTLERDLSEAGRTDMESSTTGYDVVVELIKQVVAQRPRKLIEAVADEIAGAILNRRMAVAVTVEVKKFSIPGARHVAVEIYRRQ